MGAHNDEGTTPSEANVGVGVQVALAASSMVRDE